MARVVALLAALSLSAATTRAESPASDPSPGEAVERIELRYAEPGDLVEILSAFEVEVTIDAGARALTLRGIAQEVEAASSVVAGLDRPDPSSLRIRLEIFLVLASRAPPPPGAKPLPDALREAVDRMPTPSGFTSFELLDTVVLETAPATTVDVEGELPGRGPKPATYKLRFEEVTRLPGEDPPIIRLRGLEITLFDVAPAARGEKVEEGAALPTTWASLATDIDIQADRLTAIGKAGTLRASEALVLAILARVEPAANP